MNTLFQSAENDDYKLEIHFDESPYDPRSEDTIGTIVSSHDVVGDETGLSKDELNERLDLVNEQNTVVLPVYMLDHSGVAISTTPFRSRWDSGSIGFIFGNLDDDHGIDDEGRMENVLKSEISHYSKYLNGDVYGFILRRRHRCTECQQVHTPKCHSVWGFYDIDYMKDHIPDDAEQLVDELS